MPFGFLGLIGLKTAGIVVENPATLVSLGDFANRSSACRCILDHCGSGERKVFGAVLIGILSVTLIGAGARLVQYNGFFALHRGKQHLPLWQWILQVH
ncbi:hypothetical protein OK016_29455 [Vibrio chagasii]|nr:hypothetical protein [Vibrio chagasii]